MKERIVQGSYALSLEGILCEKLLMEVNLGFERDLDSEQIKEVKRQKE